MIDKRKKIGLWLIVFIAGFAGFRLTVWLKPVDILLKAVESGGIPTDPLTRYERRFDCLRKQLDANETIGFATGVDPDQYTEYYLLTQYTLAPVLVANEKDRPVIAGFFPSPKAPEQIAALGLAVRLDCGTGAYLLSPEPGL